MERDPRPFQSVNIGLIGIETGRESFISDNHYTGPPLAAWRCNLTALSHRHNLYFVATREGIAVYQPSFPFQKLHKRPAINIPPTLAEPDAAGYIDERQPHSINHMVVGELGTEEILLVATDSGNIAAYHTKAIEEAINKQPYKFSSNGRSDIVGLRAFFSQWVHESAWGLAIHKEGRMIAVSANKPHHVKSIDPSAKVTVFAFALTSSSNEEATDESLEINDDDDLQEWHNWEPARSDIETPHRDRNFRIVLGDDDGHVNNIPSVSFVNNAEDRDGSWLLSTDITGVMKLWRIWRGICYASYECEGTLRDSARRQRDAGWIVAALDPAAFRPAMSMHQFCGWHRVRPAAQYQGHPRESLDITNIVRLKTPGRSQRHPLLGFDSEDDADDTDDEVAEHWSDEEVAEDTRSRRNIVLGLEALRLPVNDEIPLPEAGPSTISEPQSRDFEYPSPRGVANTSSAQPPISSNAGEFITLNPVNVESDSGDSEDDSEVEAEIVSSPASQGSVSSATQRTSVDLEPTPLIDTSPDQSGPGRSNGVFKKPSPTPSKRQYHELKDSYIRMPSITALQCSQFHVRLVNIPKARSPHLFCANILGQDLPEGMERTHFSHLARLSMMQQIPELGIVIIASQLGRVAVCTLTKSMSNGLLGMRVDWILPTQRQETAGMRPMVPLLGVAAAPVQGRAKHHSDDTGYQDAWAKDGIIHGVRTSFDQTVLVLDAEAKQDADGSSSDDGAPSRPPPRRKPYRPVRKRPRNAGSSSSNPRSSHSSLSSQASTTTRPFPIPEHTEGWQAVEPSRRHRLMLTYLDMTVLTYELERGTEREDIKGAVSWRTSSSTSSGSAAVRPESDSSDDQ